MMFAPGKTFPYRTLVPLGAFVCIGLAACGGGAR